MAMGPIEIRHSLFGELNKARSQKGVLWLMESMIRLNELCLAQDNTIPGIYDSGVLYAKERGEVWQDIFHLLASRYGDCEDLACWRAAELRRQGVRAGPYITWRKTPTGMVYHALVKLPSGAIEDPSLALGMRNGEIIGRPVYVQA